jgi:hypothetical protein
MSMGQTVVMRPQTPKAESVANVRWPFGGGRQASDCPHRLKGPDAVRHRLDELGKTP